MVKKLGFIGFMLVMIMAILYETKAMCAPETRHFH